MLSRQLDPNLGRAGALHLSLETLEDRACPSSVNILGDGLLVVGDHANDAVVISDNGNGTVTGSVLNGGQTVASATGNTIGKIQVQTGSGSHAINYTLSGPLTSSEKLDLLLGSGSNSVNLSYNQSISAPELDVYVQGNQGSDNVFASFGAVQGTYLNVVTQLGDGYGHCQVFQNGDLTGAARVFFGIQGGVGIDGINVQSRANIDASSLLGVRAVGGQTSDTIHVDYWGRLDGHLNFQANGGTGDDWVESNVTVDPASSGSLTDKVVGGNGVDLLILRANAGNSALRSQSILIDGGAGGSAGQDLCVHSPNVPFVNCSDQ